MGKMAQSLDKRMTDVAYIISHLPDDLNARFAGVDVKFAAISETQSLHTRRLSTIERKIDLLGGLVDGLESRMARMEAKIDLVLQRLPSQ
jgi:hypothetical protein